MNLVEKKLILIKLEKEIKRRLKKEEFVYLSSILDMKVYRIYKIRKCKEATSCHSPRVKECLKLLVYSDKGNYARCFASDCKWELLKEKGKLRDE